MEFSEYVRLRRPALLRFATVLTGRTWLADDIVSDVLGRAFERWSRISGLAEPQAYLRRMIVNDYISWHRRLARTTLRADLPDETGTVGDRAAEHAERDAMIRRLAGLPRKQRAAVVLRYYLGMSDADIADHLGCGAGTVRSQISRALATLRLDAAGEPTEATLQEAR